jgi:protein involved in polysaccharide export with SLBB domain
MRSFGFTAMPWCQCGSAAFRFVAVIRRCFIIVALAGLLALPQVVFADDKTDLAVTATAPAASYRLDVGDQVRLRAYDWRSFAGETPEVTPLSSDFRVAVDGVLFLPILGAVPVTGMTLEETAETIAGRLQVAMRLAGKPTISVEIVEYRPFYILGEVNHPGSYPYRPGLTVLQAISLAGGIYRATDRTYNDEPQVVQLKSLLANARGNSPFMAQARRKLRELGTRIALAPPTVTVVRQGADTFAARDTTSVAPGDTIRIDAANP